VLLSQPPPYQLPYSYAPTKFTGESVIKQQKSPECPSGTSLPSVHHLSTRPNPFLLRDSGWADPPTIHEIIHGKKVSVADELRIGQENVDKVGGALFGFDLVLVLIWF
jgi:hypothetical protein